MKKNDDGWGNDKIISKKSLSVFDETDTGTFGLQAFIDTFLKSHYT